MFMNKSIGCISGFRKKGRQDSPSFKAETKYTLNTSTAKNRTPGVPGQGAEYKRELFSSLWDVRETPGGNNKTRRVRH
jgi:hypothetical protein